MGKANLNSEQWRYYIQFTRQNGLLKREKGKAEYKTTDKGLSFLEHYHSAMELLHAESNKKHRKQPLNI